ncbi:FG-GAP-like repeat-containing protein [Actinomadura rudentiformis]|uniref:Esterase n=1 Tax=Actinomadura rudentiformis TaxID=359158 RepID=A0A6H9YPG6_9ACTN|nr:FG-GAP-like repeat-containing protein [Actinomadura rudentiformis]KAB2345470.1 esterase [Actinomadura rudentiformis]
MKTSSVSAFSAAAAIVVAIGAVVAVSASEGEALDAALTAGATARKPAKASDFNGDGRRDLVAVSPEGWVKGRPQAGFVTVVYGGPKGLNTKARQTIDQDSPGIPGSPQESGAFGESVGSADFDRDGYADLAVGGPWKQGVVIVYGGSRGLTGRTVHLPVSTDEAGTKITIGDFNGNRVPDLVFKGGRGVAEYWTFSDIGGRAVPGVRHRVPADEGMTFNYPTAADFNGDGHSDLVVQVVGSIDGGPSPQFLQLRLGSKKGLGPARQINRPTGDVAATGDVNGDGRADLVTRGQTTDAPRQEGAIMVYLGTRTGLGAPKTFTQDTRGVPGTGEKGDEFGYRIAVGDVNGDRKADVAIGAPYENVGKVTDAGTVTVLYGAKGGLTTKGAQLFGQDSKGVPGGAEKGDTFGRGLSLADLNGDGRAELTVGTPYENGYKLAGTSQYVWPGRLYVFTGTRAGLTVKGVKNLGPADIGVTRHNALLADPLLP